MLRLERIVTVLFAMLLIASIVVLVNGCARVYIDSNLTDKQGVIEWH